MLCSEELDGKEKLQVKKLKHEPHNYGPGPGRSPIT